MKYTLDAHTPKSDHYGGPKYPSFTLWPNGGTFTGITRAEARVIVKALNEAVRKGEIPEGTHP